MSTIRDTVEKRAPVIVIVGLVGVYADLIKSPAAMCAVVLTGCVWACAEWYVSIGQRPRTAKEIADEAELRTTLREVHAMQKQILDQQGRTSTHLSAIGQAVNRPRG